ncbi:MAG: AI-2E family transporter [Firmicutes bacterium]|nr:AI-2E family transporter [Bacillota bacterium]
MADLEERKVKIKNPWIKGMLAGFGALALAILLFLLLYNMDIVSQGFRKAMSILRPFIIGGAIAYLLCPLCNSAERWFEKLLPQKIKKWANGFAVAVSVIFLVAIVYLLIIMIIPQLYTSIVTLTETLPAQAEKFMRDIMRMLDDNETIAGYVNTIYENLRRAFDNWINNKLLPDMSTIISGVGTGVKSVISVLLDTIIGVIVAVYCLSGRRTFARQAKMVLYSITGQRWGDILRDEAGYADKMFNSFLSGKFVDSAIIGVICYLFCIIARMPNSLLVSVIIGITNIIPFFGPFIGAIPMSLLILIEDPMKALIFAIFILILQQIDGNIIGPKILGDSTGLSSFWVLFAIMVFGGVFGFIGMIIGVPLFAVIYDILEKLIKRGLARKNIAEEKYAVPDEAPEE